MRIRTLVAIATVAVAAASCTGEDQEPTVVADEPSETPTTETPDSEPTETPSDVASYVFEEPITWEENGVSMAVTELEIAAPGSSEVAEIVQYAETEPSAVVAMMVEVSNDSGREVEFWPEYGTIHIGREQVSADILVSGEVGGTLRDGVDSTGAALFLLTETEYEAAVEVGSLTYVIDAALDAETYDTITDDVELTVDW